MRMASKIAPTGTLSICALRRSTSTKTWGVEIWNVVKMFEMPGVWRARLIRSSDALNERRRAEREAILKPHREAGGIAHAAHGRRHENERLGILDHGEALAHIGRHGVDRETEAITLVRGPPAR